MKTLRSRVLTVVLSLVAGVAFGAPAQDFEKKIVEQFPIASDGEVEIINRYGKVEVETWDETEVKIEVTIIVEAKNQGKADEVFERINVNFSNTSSLVRAATDIASGSKWDKWFGNSSNKFEINYHVWVPSTVEVDLTNKYGDIVVASMDGDAEIELKYGNLRMDAIGGDLSVNFGYGKASITSGGNADLELKYCTLQGGDFKDVRATTKYSTLNLGNIEVLQSSSAYDAYKVESATTVSNFGKYDDLEFGHVQSVTVNSKYTHLEVAKLTDEADLNFRHGGIKIRELADGFSKVGIAGDYTSVNISTAPSTQFHFEAEGRHTSIKHSNVEAYYDVQNSGGNSEVRGYRGSKDAGGQIIAKMSYGTFKID